MCWALFWLKEQIEQKLFFQQQKVKIKLIWKFTSDSTLYYIIQNIKIIRENEIYILYI